MQRDWRRDGVGLLRCSDQLSAWASLLARGCRRAGVFFFFFFFFGPPPLSFLLFSFFFFFFLLMGVGSLPCAAAAGGKYGSATRAANSHGLV